MARIYIETTIPSFYYEVRTEPKMVARKAWTREWWAKAIARDELLVSTAVIDELQRGTFPGKDDALALVNNLPLIPVDQDVLEIAAAYIAHRVMPIDPKGDALHLALASHRRCDFLVTWNCQHLANANKFGHIRRVNGIMGVHETALVTPLELLTEEEL
jgi:hypothetical protein